MPQTLPRELLRLIFTHIYITQDLCSLSLTCHAFRDEAQSALFSNCVVPIHPSQHRRPVPFFDAMISSPNRLALNVRKLTIAFNRLQAVDGLDVERDDFVAWLEELGSEIRMALKLMHRLTHLRVVMDDGVTYNLAWLPSLLNGCTFKLKVLIWGAYKTDAKQFFRDSLVAQDELGVLLLYPGPAAMAAADPDPEVHSLLQQCCPQIHTLSAPWYLVRAILERHQNITCVCTGGPYCTEHTSPVISSDALQRVHYFWYQNTIDTLGFSIASLRNVIVLQVGCIFEKEYAAIAALPRLEVLLVSHEQWEMIMDHTKFDAWLKYAFTHSATLKKIYMSGFACYGSDNRSYTCYTYDPATDKIQWRDAYRPEMTLWRGGQYDLTFGELIYKMPDKLRKPNTEHPGYFYVVPW